MCHHYKGIELGLTGFEDATHIGTTLASNQWQTQNIEPNKLK